MEKPRPPVKRPHCTRRGDFDCDGMTLTEIIEQAREDGIPFDTARMRTEKDEIFLVRLEWDSFETFSEFNARLKEYNEVTLPAWEAGQKEQQRLKGQVADLGTSTEAQKKWHRERAYLRLKDEFQPEPGES